MLDNIAKFAAALEEGVPEGYVGVAYGAVLEKIVRHKDIEKGDVEKSSAIALMIGWESKEMHLKFRDSDLFKENIGLLREKNSGVEMFHVLFRAVR